MDRGVHVPVAMVAVVLLVACAPIVHGSHQGSSFLGPVDDLKPYRGDLHAHTAFSDGEGWPTDAYQAAKSTGLDFFAVTDHAEQLAVPYSTREGCLSPTLPRCEATPLPTATEYQQTGLAAQAASDDGFVALRGFEWSSPVEGHVNVLGTELYTDVVQTGPAPMTPFYAWLSNPQLAPERVAAFNHPGDAPAGFDAFLHNPIADERMGLIEAFTGDEAYTEAVLEALDAGWNLAVIGTSDGHTSSEWTDPGLGRTVVLAPELDRPTLLDALAQGRTIATLGSDLDARVSVGSTIPGERLDPGDQETLYLDYHVKDGGGQTFSRIDVLGPEGWSKTKAPIGVSETNGFFSVPLDALGTTATGDRYLVLRAWQGTTPVLMTSPIWIEAPSGGAPTPS